jgi:hypothetical protein
MEVSVRQRVRTSSLFTGPWLGHVEKSVEGGTKKRKLWFLYEMVGLVKVIVYDSSPNSSTTVAFPPYLYKYLEYQLDHFRPAYVHTLQYVLYGVPECALFFFNVYTYNGTGTRSSGNIDVHGRPVQQKSGRTGSKLGGIHQRCQFPGSWTFGSAPTSRRYSTKSRLVTVHAGNVLGRFYRWARYSVDVGAVLNKLFS